MIFDWKQKSDEAIAKFVILNHERLAKRRQLGEDLWSMINTIFRPRRYDMLNKDRLPGKQFGSTIYDQKPANALNKFVGGKLGYMVSRRIPWLQFISPDRRLMQLDHVKKYAQDAAEQILYAAGRSNLYSALTPLALDAHSSGTGYAIPMTDNKKDRVVFEVVNPGQCYIATDMYGDPYIYHRTLKLTALTAMQMFEEEKLPRQLVVDVKGSEGQGGNNPFNEYEFIWAVYPNDDRYGNSKRSEDKQWLTLVVYQGGKRGQSLVHKAGRDDFPIAWRSGRESGWEYGTSVSADCLTSALVGNKLGEKAVTAAHLAVEPAVVHSKSIKRSMHLNPGGRTAVNDIQREGIKPVMDGSQKWPITDAQMDRLHAMLDDRMFIKFFEMLSSGDLVAKTAYEVSQAMGEKAVMMSTIVGDFEQEALEPAIGYLIKAEDEAGRMPDPPDELIETRGRIDIQYLGPLAQLQRSLLRSKGIIDSLEIMGAVMSLNQQAGWKINWLELMEEATVAQGMPQKLINSDEQVQQIQQQVEQERQQMAQNEIAEQAGKLLPAISKKPESGSPAAEMMEAAGAGGEGEGA